MLGLKMLRNGSALGASLPLQPKPLLLDGQSEAARKKQEREGGGFSVETVPVPLLIPQAVLSTLTASDNLEFGTGASPSHCQNG